MNPTILPDMYLAGFDGTNLVDLVDKGQVGGCHQSLVDALEADHSPLSPHFVQYVLVREDGSQVPVCPRLKLDCLDYFSRAESVADVRMGFILVDLDLGPSEDEPSEKHRTWKPGEFESWYFSVVSRFPVLDSAVVYESPHGCKALWQIREPFRPNDSGWTEFYLKFCSRLNGFGPGGESPDIQRSPWVSSFRVPRGDNFKAQKIMYGSAWESGYSLLPSEIEVIEQGLQVVQTQAVSYVSNGGSFVTAGEPASSNIVQLKTALTIANQLADRAIEEFEALPLVKWCCSNALTLSYKLWWYMGTNIYALYDDKTKALEKWHEFSSLDSGRYSQLECDRQFEEIGKYFERGKGPVTYKRFRDQMGVQTWSVIFTSAGPSPSSSPAGQAQREARRSLPKLVQQMKDSEDGPLPPDKVWGLLSLKEVGPKDAKATVVNKSRIDNLETILRVDQHFHGRLRCDLLGAIDRWDHPEQGEKTANDPDCFTDARSYISKSYGVDFGDLETRKWFTAAAYKKAFHPVQDYLYSLVWDGVDRIEELIKAISCDVTDYSRLIMRKWLISCVVRPLQVETAFVRDYSYLNDGKRKPMKVDNTLVLMGDQGSGDWGGKTTFFETMAVQPEWYTDYLPSITKNRKDAALTVIDSWIIEMGEVDDYKSKNDEGSMKRFLSATREKFRRPYDTGNKSWWRGCVFVGTTNKNQFLNDPTGDRRYWTLPVGQTIDVPKITEIRDQLWAQAVYLFEQGEVWWLQGAERELQQIANAEFRCLDATEEYIREWLASTQPKFIDTNGTYGPRDAVVRGGVTPLEIAQGALGKLLGDASNADLQRIGMTMHNLGYKKVRRTVDGVQKKIYIKL